MCCNRCYHFNKCKKAKKSSSSCCPDCAEYEFCPFVLGESAIKEMDSPYGDGEADMEMFDGDDI